MGYAISDGYRIYYEQTGAGDPMVLVHGWGSDMRHNWVDTGWVSSLKTHRSIITLDVRGHGRSDKPHETEPYSYAAMSNDVLSVMDALEIARADYLGYSMGAFMGAYLLGHHADRFCRMILGGIGDETDESAAQGQAIAAALRAPTVDDIPHRGGRQTRRFVEAIADHDLEALACSALQMWPEGYPLKVAGPGMANAGLPVMVINGADDDPYIRTAHQFAAALPDGTNITLSGRDHLTAVSDERFKQHVISFLLAR